ncbi:helix-turn-helix domain-containing protein [Pseudomonas sp. TNT11]|uniref:Helix-turn-helix domain-containing protein n=1 Tax=Pseudomonas emilianonis TaxID=2915812 RepID=A0ABT0EBL0_9PSED|nr:helix-turn-helix domain-containing protein [Pseudomonas emilianonis]MCK1783110.1 helix-turn-helix domain-containing protein [Pseudomonas emilianonis]
MSYKAYDWVWTHEFESTTAKLVMMALAKHASEKGKGWPGVKTLASFCGISSRTVQRHIKEFERAGLLTIQKKYRRDGGQTTNRYFINLTSAQALAPTDRDVIGGMTAVTPLPRSATCHGGHDTAMTCQELPTEPKKELQQTADDDLRFPKRLKAGDSAWIVQLLNDVPRQDHQMLLDELSEALKSGIIITTPQRWFYGLKKNYLKGNFCALAKPSRPKPKVEDPIEPYNSDKPLWIRTDNKKESMNALKRQTRNKTHLQ